MGSEKHLRAIRSLPQCELFKNMNHLPQDVRMDSVFWFFKHLLLWEWDLSKKTGDRQ